MPRELLSDVNLSAIVFSGQGGELSLVFLNMSDGGEVGTLSCGGVVSFAYHDHAESALPAHVGSVTVDEIGASEHAREQTPLQRVCLEGWLTVHVVCRKVNFR